MQGPVIVGRAGGLPRQSPSNGDCASRSAFTKDLISLWDNLHSEYTGNLDNINFLVFLTPKLKCNVKPIRGHAGSSSYTVQRSQLCAVGSVTIADKYPNTPIGRTRAQSSFPLVKNLVAN